ncbi:MAG: GTP 3',8-cyclase MoaA, partial [Candidatus Thermoplasmatota archaeon]|nr:GTP 3',8-cyclase MoaA [Candidatus Thermoplasmatota archaeon]
ESISKPFCNSCTRVRVSANGNLYTCLFSETGHDLKSLIRMGADINDLTEAISTVWTNRDDRYSQIRNTINENKAPVEMHFIGG